MAQAKEKRKKPVLRFRFILLFAAVTLAAIFVIYVLGTSLEDVLKEKPNSQPAETGQATAVTTTAPEDSVAFVQTTTAEPEETDQPEN